jgi:hypothetical protein
LPRGGELVDRFERSLVAHLAGLPRFPGEDAPADEPGAHVMGVTVHAWLAGEPIRRWGVGWLTGGTMSLRFRRPLHSGDPLALTVEHAPAHMTFELRTPAGVLVADGNAGMAGPSVAGSSTVALLPAPESFMDASVRGLPLAPLADALEGRSLGAIEFDFVAARDRTLLACLDPDDPWRELHVAHPAWLATGVNALIGRRIAFTAGRWINAGTAMRSLRPIETGARVRLVGRVERLFEAGCRHFADIAVLVLAGGAPAAVFVSTIVYA